MIVAFNVTFFINNILFLELIDYIFNDKKSMPVKIIAAVFSCGAGSLMLYTLGSMSSLGYGIMLAVYLVLIIFVYRDGPLLSKLLCVLTFTIHIMVSRALVSSIAALVTGYSILELSQDPVCFWAVLTMTAALNLSFSALILRIVPQDKLRVVSSKIQQMLFAVSIAGLAAVYLIMNGMVYITEITFAFLEIHQIVMAVLWMSVLYVGMFVLLGFDVLSKDKEELEKGVQEGAMYKSAFEIYTDTILEINCTLNKLTDTVVRGERVGNLPDVKYTEYLESKVLSDVHEDDIETVQTYGVPDGMIAQYKQGRVKYSYEFRTRDSEYGDEYRWFRADVSMREDEAGEIIAISTMNDIHELKKQELALRDKANKDSLLDILNKSASEQSISEHLSENEIGTLFLLDLDNFKLINDNMGHQYGDDVLREVTKKIKQNFRRDDILGRIGGDEFMMFVCGNMPAAEVENKAQKLCRDIRKVYSDDKGVEVELSCSIGIAVAPEHGKGFEQLYRASDLAMYASKRAGKNMHTRYNREVHGE